LHALPFAQTKPLHDVATLGTQTPAPLHDEGPAVAEVPSAEPTQTVAGQRASVAPLATSPQVPSVPLAWRVARQERHAPSHAVSQQTPSTQWPELHAPPLPHALPFAPRTTQTPLTQPAVGTQSVSTEHAALQAEFALLQAYGAHADVARSAHPPVPSQRLVIVEALVHVDAGHRASACPLAAKPHVPSTPPAPWRAARHELQRPLHGLSQQTPSTQRSDAQSEPTVHALPFAGPSSKK
jgi:hypothetical protein